MSTVLPRIRELNCDRNTSATSVEETHLRSIQEILYDSRKTPVPPSLASEYLSTGPCGHSTLGKLLHQNT